MPQAARVGNMYTCPMQTPGTKTMPDMCGQRGKMNIEKTLKKVLDICVCL